MIVKKYEPPVNPAFLRTCDDGVGRHPWSRCGEPAVLELALYSRHDAESETLCVKHVFLLIGELNAYLLDALTPVDTEGG